MEGKRVLELTDAEKREQQRKRRAWLTALIRATIALLAVAVILLNLFTHVLQVVRYNGESMTPTLSGGQTLILRKTKNVSPGDVIAFYYNNQVLVRRVICEGGDQLSIANDGTVSVNGSALEERYVEEPSVGQCNLTFPYLVSAGCVFVMGDNRVIAMDSRLAEIGPIPEQRIIGKVLFAF